MTAQQAYEKQLLRSYLAKPSTLDKGGIAGLIEELSKILAQLEENKQEREE